MRMKIYVSYRHGRAQAAPVVEMHEWFAHILEVNAKCRLLDCEKMLYHQPFAAKRNDEPEHRSALDQELKPQWITLIDRDILIASCRSSNVYGEANLAAKNARRGIDQPPGKFIDGSVEISRRWNLRRFRGRRDPRAHEEWPVHWRRACTKIHALATRPTPGSFEPANPHVARQFAQQSGN